MYFSVHLLGGNRFVSFLLSQHFSDGVLSRNSSGSLLASFLLSLLNDIRQISRPKLAAGLNIYSSNTVNRNRLPPCYDSSYIHAYPTQICLPYSETLIGLSLPESTFQTVSWSKYVHIYRKSPVNVTNSLFFFFRPGWSQDLPRKGAETQGSYLPRWTTGGNH